MSVLIKNGHIFTAVDNYVADMLVDDGKIRTIGIDLTADAEKATDAAGQYVIPGASTHTLTWIFPSAALSPQTISAPAQSQLRWAAQPALSILWFSSGAKP